MASEALAAFQLGAAEVQNLQRADPTPRGRPPADAEVTRVLGRASVVLLCSHFERYIYAVNEEAVQACNAAGIVSDSLPEPLRLLHSQPVVDDLGTTGWEKRTLKLEGFVRDEAWLWTRGASGPLVHERTLVWMKAPSPKNLVRYYGYWEIADVFSTITRARNTRNELWLKIDELVRKRNNVAHGDATTEATWLDIRSYKAAAKTFCERADAALSRVIGRVTGEPRPW